MKVRTKLVNTRIFLATLAVLAIGASIASAQSCDIDTFSSANGDAFLQAQDELVKNENPQAALAAISKLQQGSLSCYEEGAVLGLSVQAKLETGDYSGAIQDLRAQIDKGLVDPSTKLVNMKAVWQLYFQEDKLREGLDYSKRWISAGGRPTRDEKWSFAIVNNNLEDYQGALLWAEQVYQADGENASEQVTQFLIFLYEKTNQPAKREALIERCKSQNQCQE